MAVCACPAGVAHTYIVADRFEAYAKRMGYDAKVETQGLVGIENKLTAKDIEDAYMIVMANDIAISEPERFTGYEDKIITSNMHEALRRPEAIFSRFHEKKENREENND